MIKWTTATILIFIILFILIMLFSNKLAKVTQVF